MRAPVSETGDYSLFGDFYLTWFEQLICRLGERLEPTETLLVNYESPVLPRDKWDPEKRRMVAQTSIYTVRRLGSMGVMLEAICKRCRDRQGWAIDVREAQIQALKNELAGSRKASKLDMIFVARRAGIILPPGEEAKDAADSFAAWLNAVRHHAPEQQALWDRKLYGQMPRA